MSPWLWMLVGVVLSGAVTWYLLKQAWDHLDLQNKEILQRLDDDRQNVSGRLADLRATVEAAMQPEPEHPLTGVAFLPTDMEAAAMERMIAASEDRAIHAGGGTVPSSGPSRRLAARSLGAVSTRRARNSGGGS